MRSREIFPLKERHSGKPLPFDSFTTSSGAMLHIIKWVNKYHEAFLAAQQQVKQIEGAKEYKNAKGPKWLVDQTFIPENKKEYDWYCFVLGEYKKVLKVIEKKLEKLLE